MSVKILPYLDLQASFSAKPVENTTENTTSFQEVLSAEKRAREAMAVDARIAKGEVIPMFSSSAAETSSSSASAATASHSPVSSSASSSTSAVNGCPEELDPYFREAAETYQVDINLLKAVAKAESGFSPSATSSAGAMGVMQLMPSTAKSLGITDAYNAHDNILGGAKLLSQNLARYNGDVSLALAGYNAGCGNVDKYGGIPPFKETQNYVRKVLGYYDN